MLAAGTDRKVEARTDTKDAIGQAALSLFAERSYAAVSVRDIAERVGIRQGAIYNHYAGKQAILFALMEGHMRTLLGTLKREGLTEGAPVERLAAFVRFHVRYHLEQPDDVFIAYMELRSLEPENRAAVKALRRAYEAELRAILQAGIASGDFIIADIPVVAMGIIAMMTGVTTWYRAGGRFDADEVAEIHVGMALRAVGWRRQESDREV